MAQREQRNRHDKEAPWVHREISKKYGPEASSTESAMNTNPYQSRAMKTKTDIAVPADQNIAKTQNEQAKKSRQIPRTVLGIKLIQQASKVSCVAKFARALETISKDARTWHEKLGIPDIIVRAQPSAMLGTAYVLKKVICV